MVKRILSSMGIGSAEVDLVLPSTSVERGTAIEGEVEVHGGSADQDVDGIYFALLTEYADGTGRSTAVVDDFELAEAFTVGAEEERSFPVSLDVPYYTPVTMGGTKVWIETGMDIDWAVDPDDTDEIRVQPDPLTEGLLGAMEELGFRFEGSTCLNDERGTFDPDNPYVQEFTFRPRSAEFADLEDVEIVLVPHEEEMELVVEIDRRGELVEELATGDETRVTLRYDESDLPITEALGERIERKA